MHGMDSPGPSVYMLKTTMGKQDDSTIKSPPTWAFSTAARDTGVAPAHSNTGLLPARRATPKRPMTAPGPQKYSLRASVGPQVSSKTPSSPMPTFGTSTVDQNKYIYISPEHEKGQVGKFSPGPQANYEVTASVGQQKLSKFGSQPAWGFGTAS